LAGLIIIVAAPLLCKQAAQPIENIGQTSLPGNETILLCKGCVAQHYYKKAATHWFYYTKNPVNWLFSLMITMSYRAWLSCIQEGLSFSSLRSDYHVLRTLCSIMARPWVWFRWCDLVHKKALPASFMHHVIAGRAKEYCAHRRIT